MEKGEKMELSGMEKGREKRYRETQRREMEK